MLEQQDANDLPRAMKSRVEERRGGWGHVASLRSLSPFIEPDVRISRIRLCAWKGEKQFPSITATSASGYKQTLAGLKTTSALHPGADLPGGVAEGPFLTQAVL